MMVSTLASGVKLAVDALKIPHARRLPVLAGRPGRRRRVGGDPESGGRQTHLVAER